MAAVAAVAAVVPAVAAVVLSSLARDVRLTAGERPLSPYNLYDVRCAEPGYILLLFFLLVCFADGGGGGGWEWKNGKSLDAIVAFQNT